MAINEHCDRCGKPLEKVQAGTYSWGQPIEIYNVAQIKIDMQPPYISDYSDGSISHNVCLCPKCAKPVVHMIEFLNDNLTAYMERSKK